MDTCTLGRENRMRITWRKADGKVGGQRDSHLWCSRDWFTTWLFTSHVHVSVRASYMCHEDMSPAAVRGGACFDRTQWLGVGRSTGLRRFPGRFCHQRTGWLDMTQAWGIEHRHRTIAEQPDAAATRSPRRSAATHTATRAPAMRGNTVTPPSSNPRQDE